ncbi:MAG: ATP-binding protein [Lachnospiraceae bacterium]|nr:ATP-binding protein [Lachnospiraceae bacterium]
MKRNAITRLKAWKEKEFRKPMWMTGIKGAGKTYLALDFAKSFYEGNLYVNFETNASIRELFKRKAESVKEDFNLISPLCEYYQIPEELIGNVLIILDEITASKEALNALDMFAGEENGLSVLIISSNGAVYENMPKEKKTKYEHFMLYPMEFDEFLQAIGSEWYAEVIKGHYQTNRKIPTIVHNELITLFEDYLAVGGMPAAVNEYITMDSVENVPEIHRMLYGNMQREMIRHAAEGEAIKMEQIFQIMLPELLKENKKFQFRMIRKGATYAMYRSAIEKLVQNAYLLQCKKQESFDAMEEGREEEKVSFKLYLPDIGILNTLIAKNYPVGDSEELFEQAYDNGLVRKTLLENYTMQSLTAKGYEPVFWESASQAKLDFVIRNKDGIIPLEAKASESSRSKSISIFRNQVDVPYAVKISSKNYEYANQIKYLPYYAIFCL